MLSSMFAVPMEFGLNPKSNTLGLEWPQHDRLATCVIAQQYSSAIFFSLRFHYGKENNGCDLKEMLLFEIFTCLEIV